MLTALVTLLSGFVAVTGAATAGADTYPHCREHPQTGNGYKQDGKWLYIFWILYTEPAFFKKAGTGQVVENETDSTASRVASFSVTHTVAINNSDTNATQQVLAEGIAETRTTATSVTASIAINQT